jgi:hypothetical protein
MKSSANVPTLADLISAIETSRGVTLPPVTESRQ